jgi:hypothetical protein
MAKKQRNLSLQIRRARSLIGIGAITVLAGIGLAATGDASLGALLTLPSLVLLIYALHRFGRTGPDAPIEF